MILTFKTKHDNGTPTKFIEKILNTQKKHTIRTGKRWKAGMSIQMCTGRFKNVFQFNKLENWNVFHGLVYIISDNKGNDFLGLKSVVEGIQKVVSIQYIEIIASDKMIIIKDNFDDEYGKPLNTNQIKFLTMNDGFDSENDFWDYFKEDTCGQIIHWTNLRY